MAIDNPFPSGIKLADTARVRNVLEYLHAHPEALKVAKELAQRSLDMKLSMLERVSAQLALNDLLIALDALIHDASEDGIPHPEEPEYRWVNGAKVRVSK